ncbi:hypothetical protein HYU15_00860 [Candidatus Woesearchaeota archaeon]|nr:hypothetical protein [Candidatus Woesearchaeota archaeon]
MANRINSRKNSILINLELEKSKLNREKSILVLDKALLLYFSFLFIGVIGFINGYLTVQLLNMLVLMSFGVLIIGIAPYWITMRREEKSIEALISEAKKGGHKT